MLKNIFGRLASAGDRMGVRNPGNYVFTMTVAEALELSSEIDRLIRGEKELKSRIAELEGQQRWQPIETAPRDGT